MTSSRKPPPPSGVKKVDPSPQEINMLVAHYNQGRFAEMETLARQMTVRFPNYGIGWKAMGTALLLQNRNEESLEPLQKAVVLLQKDSQSHNYLGNTLVKLDRLSEAEASYRRALKLDPKFVEAQYNLGDTLQKAGRLPEAEASFRLALKIKPDLFEAHWNLGNILQLQGRLAEAEASYRCALKIRPDFHEVHYNLGHILRMLCRLPEAEESYRRVLELNPDDARARCYLADVLKVQGRLPEALEIIRDTLHDMDAGNPRGSTDPVTATPITALLPFGRAGSLFFHSLFDGHPELATLPGVYFKGWFDSDLWKRFAPHPSDPKWRERLARMVVMEFQPLFDAHSRKNVMGDPLAGSLWLAKDSGFMDMGADRSQPFVVDQDAFATAFLSLLAPLFSVGHKTCFELIHRAFEVAIRGNTGAGSRAGGHIFYHIHNPMPFELANFLHYYPQARLLYIVRNPVQGMESWMLSEIDGDTALASVKDAGASSGLEMGYLLHRWNKIAEKAEMLNKMRSPFNILFHSRGVRLEDVKRDARRVMPQIAAWMGVQDHPSLYEASFCGLQYWGPASKLTGKITGFDTKAIDRPLGRLLGSRDILIFETLFWPFSRLYGYTDLDGADFRQQLAEIRPWLDEPLEFEKRLYAELPDHTRAVEELLPYSRLHRLLRQTWAVLDRDGTYHGMVQPLKLD